jgi:DNA-binding MarR family transcriptional regulator
MTHESYTQAGALVTSLFLEAFRFNGRLLAAGDQLVAGLGLTSARWQVLGAVALADRPQPVAHIARTMGLSRQNVQRIVNDLSGARYLDFTSNPHHKRAKLVLLTAAGREVYDAAHRRQVPWANRLGEAFTADQIRDAMSVLHGLRTALETEENQNVEEYA